MNGHDKGGLRETLRSALRFAVAVILLFACNAMSSSAAARAPWVSLLVALERGYRPGIEELPRLAAAMADAPEEVLIAWDRQGRFLFHAVGNNYEVKIPHSLTRKLKGSVLIHNHPRGFPPSARDLDTALRYGLRRSYVTARIRGVVSLTDLDVGEALRRSRGRVAVMQPAWRPVVEVAPPVAVQGPVVVAAQVAYGLLGDWL